MYARTFVQTYAQPAIIGRHSPLEETPTAVAQEGEHAPVHVLGRGRRDTDAVHVKICSGHRRDLEEVGRQGDLAAQSAHAGVVGHGC